MKKQEILKKATITLLTITLSICSCFFITKKGYAETFEEIDFNKYRKAYSDQEFPQFNFSIISKFRYYDQYNTFEISPVNDASLNITLYPMESTSQRYNAVGGDIYVCNGDRCAYLNDFVSYENLGLNSVNQNNKTCFYPNNTISQQLGKIFEIPRLTLENAGYHFITSSNLYFTSVYDQSSSTVIQGNQLIVAYQSVQETISTLDYLYGGLTIEGTDIYDLFDEFGTDYKFQLEMQFEVSDPFPTDKNSINRTDSKYLELKKGSSIIYFMNDILTRFKNKQFIASDWTFSSDNTYTPDLKTFIYKGNQNMTFSLISPLYQSDDQTIWDIYKNYVGINLQYQWITGMTSALNGRDYRLDLTTYELIEEDPTNFFTDAFNWIGDKLDQIKSSILGLDIDGGDTNINIDLPDIDFDLQINDLIGDLNEQDETIDLENNTNTKLTEEDEDNIVSLSEQVGLNNVLDIFIDNDLGIMIFAPLVIGIGALIIL